MIRSFPHPKNQTDTNALLPCPQIPTWRDPAPGSLETGQDQISPAQKAPPERRALTYRSVCLLVLNHETTPTKTLATKVFVGLQDSRRFLHVPSRNILSVDTMVPHVRENPFVIVRSWSRFRDFRSDFRFHPLQARVHAFDDAVDEWPHLLKPILLFLVVSYPHCQIPTCEFEPRTCISRHRR